MSKQTTIEQRLTSLEKAVYQIQDQLKNKSNSDNWLQQLSGSISDEELFLEVLESRNTKDFRKIPNLITEDWSR